MGVSFLHRPCWQIAREADWRFRRAKAQQEKATDAPPLCPSGACDAVFRMYKRECPFNGELKDLIDGMLTIDPTKRLTLDQVAAHAWIKGAQWFKAAPPPGASDQQARINIYRGVDDGRGPAPTPPDGAPQLQRQIARLYPSTSASEAEYESDPEYGDEAVNGAGAIRATKAARRI